MAEELNLHFSSVFTREDTSSLHVLTLLTLMAFSLSSRGSALSFFGCVGKRKWDSYICGTALWGKKKCT